MERVKSLAAICLGGLERKAKPKTARMCTFLFRDLVVSIPLCVCTYACKSDYDLRMKAVY